MCILFIAVDQHPVYPLVIAANRDEYHARPTRAMHYWGDSPGILAGRDLREGGTWLGVNRHGRIAAVTNFRLPGNHDPHSASRGELVSRFLRNQESIESFSGFLRRDYRRYNPFNLVYGDVHALYCFSSVSADMVRLDSGYHSISNGALDDLWPKMSRGVAALTTLVSDNAQLDAADLARAMLDRKQAHPDLVPDTGLALTHEVQLSSIFIKGDEYGTRTTTILLATPQQLELYEHNYDREARACGSRRYTVKIDRHEADTDAGPGLPHR
jgi:uncharacterized protein with NRDE domain